MKSILIFEQDRKKIKEIRDALKQVDSDCRIIEIDSIRKFNQKLKSEGIDLIIFRLGENNEKTFELLENLENQDINVVAFESGTFFEIILKDRQQAGIIMKEIILTK